MDSLTNMDQHNNKDLRDITQDKSVEELQEERKKEFERQREEIANHQEPYYDQTLRNIKNFLPSGSNPNNGAFFDERSNHLSSKGD